MKTDSLLASPAELESYFDRLWPLCRSITGNGFRQSLQILSELVPFQVEEVPTGTPVFDWIVPKEWNIEDAWIENEKGVRVVDFRQNNLHVVGYSVPVDQWLSLEDLQAHLHSIPEQPDAIPYVTSYYRERWGFCLSQRQRDALKPGRYRAVVRSTLMDGHLTYGHYLLKASRPTDREVLLSSYLCHPSMANNELSGPLTLAFLFRALSRLPDRNVNFRFVIVPETIGSITFLSRFGEELKRNCIAGYAITCCGDSRPFTYRRSRRGDTLADRVMEEVLRRCDPHHRVIPFNPGFGSDDRQYCSPGFDLPVGSLMRSTYDSYPEYHTSLDNKGFLRFDKLAESVGTYFDAALALDRNRVYENLLPNCEPRLGPRGLYENTNHRDTTTFVEMVLNLWSWSDGRNDLCRISELTGFPVPELRDLADTMCERGVLAVKD